MTPTDDSADRRRDPRQGAVGEADDADRCASCGRPLWWDGQPPSRDGNAWICGECDAARNFDALDP